MENMNNNKTEIVIFDIDGLRFALPLHVVDSVIRIVEVTHIPGLPEYVDGIVNIHGAVTPVINLRKKMHLPERKLNLEDKLLIVKSRDYSYALIVDSVSDVIEMDLKNSVQASKIMPDMAFLEKIVKTDSGMIIVNDMDAFVKSADSDFINAVLER